MLPEGSYRECATVGSCRWLWVEVKGSQRSAFRVRARHVDLDLQMHCLIEQTFPGRWTQRWRSSERIGNGLEIAEEPATP